MSVTCVSIPSLTASAVRINNAHSKSQAAGRTMLQWAIEAGRELLEVKKGLKHGEFQPWCTANLTFSYRTCADYMRMAKNAERCTFDVATSIRAVIAATVEAKAPSAPHATLTPDDAIRIQKLARMANGGNEHEEAVAQEMLDKMASRFGMTEEEAQVAASKLCPEVPSHDDVVAKATEFKERLDARLSAATAEIRALIEQQGVEEAVVTLAHTLIRLKFPKEFGHV